MQELDSIFAEALGEIHDYMDETECFIHRPRTSGSDAAEDSDFSGIFHVRGIDTEEEDDFMLSIEFDAILDCAEYAVDDLSFDKGDLISRNKDKSTFEVAASYFLNGEVRILLIRTEQTMLGVH